MTPSPPPSASPPAATGGPGWRGALAIAAAWWLLADLTAVWGPSLITIFGQAAATPPEYMGLFALGCVLAGVALAWAALRGAPVAWLALAGALACRVVLAFVPGGQTQLWAASVGLACAVAWLVRAVAAHGRDLGAGLALGWTITATVAALGGTWLPVWRTDVYGIAATVLLAAALLGTAGLARAEQAPPGRRQAWTLMPLALVAGVAVVNPGRASAVDAGTGPSVLVLGCVLALLVASSPRPRGLGARVAAAVVALVAVLASLYPVGGDVPGALAPWAVAVFLVGPPALVVLLDADPRARAARPLAVGAGAVLWVLLFFAYYAGYDLGYRADALLVAVAALLGILAVLAGRGSAPEADPGARLRDPVLLGAVALAVVLGAVGAATHRQPEPYASVDTSELSVVAWNLRMGYGMDGTFRPEAVAEAVKEFDVVMLSEIDRGWLLNGGQDQLAILARLTGKSLHFAPAADPVWGDAVLTSLPVDRVEPHPLDSYGAVTGAGALAVRLDLDGGPVWAVSTHVQPTATRSDGTIDQARDLAALVGELADDAPVVLGGDFNLEPDSDSFAALLDAGMVDALAQGRPVLTSPADDPVQQIDHLFVTDGLTVEPEVFGLSIQGPFPSDHLPVMARLRIG